MNREMIDINKKRSNFLCQLRSDFFYLLKGKTKNIFYIISILFLSFESPKFKNTDATIELSTFSFDNKFLILNSLKKIEINNNYQENLYHLNKNTLQIIAW